MYVIYIITYNKQGVLKGEWEKHSKLSTRFSHNIGDSLEDYHGYFREVVELKGLTFSSAGSVQLSGYSVQEFAQRCTASISICNRTQLWLI